MREARIIVPNKPEHHHVARELRHKLAHSFGGYTETIGYGGWVDPRGELIAEAVIVYDVAMADTAENVTAIRALADHVRVAARQQAVYLRLPSGNVEFIEAPASVEAA